MKSIYALLLLAALSTTALGQVPDLTSLDYDRGGEFNFVRVQFDTYYGRGFRGYGGPWSIDF
ncbi:MAG TPA: hypothetical protein QGI39_02180, partial [Gammaproteobacteria bacterium]|nr:hypothetical protein [Gammaproteobacteria bacterium]